MLPSAGCSRVLLRRLEHYVFVAHNALGICWGARKYGVKKKQEQFEFTFENVLAKLNMVIWVSLRFFFLFFSLSLFSRPIYNAANALRERIKGFFFVRFNLCDTSVYTNVLYVLCYRHLADSPNERPPRTTASKIPRPYFSRLFHREHPASVVIRTRVPKNRTRLLWRVRYEIGYNGCPKTTSAFYAFSRATCFRPDEFEKNAFFDKCLRGSYTKILSSCPLYL